MRRLLAVVGVSLLVTTPVQAHKPGICESERKAAVRYGTYLNKALRASVFGGDGVRYISRDLDLNGIGDVLDYLDKRFLPLAAKTNQMWAKYSLCIAKTNLEIVEQRLQQTIDEIGEDNRTQSCKVLLRAWTLCLRNEPIN